MTDQKQIDRVMIEFSSLIRLNLNSPILKAIPHTAMVKAIVYSSDKDLSCRQIANKYGVSVKTAATIIKEKTSIEK